MDESLILSGHVSVGAWEESCQKALVEITVPAPGLKVLEIGYGLGMASRALSGARFPALHVIVERDAGIAGDALRSGAIGSATLLVSDWVTAAHTLRQGTFDAIVFDADPEVAADISWKVADVCRWALPAMRGLSPLLKPGGRMGFLDFTSELRSNNEFVEAMLRSGLTLEHYQVPIWPPPSCRYARPGNASIMVIVKTQI